MTITAVKSTPINYDATTKAASRVKASYAQIEARDLDLSSEGGVKELTSLLKGVLNQIQNEASMDALGLKSSSKEEAKTDIATEIGLLRAATKTFFGEAKTPAKDSISAQIKKLETAVNEKKVPRPNIGAGILGAVDFQSRPEAIGKLTKISDALSNNSKAITGGHVSPNTFTEQGKLLLTAIKTATNEKNEIDEAKLVETLSSNPNVRIGTKFLKVAQASIQGESKSHNPLIRASLSKVPTDKNDKPSGEAIITRFFKNGAIQFPAENSRAFKSGVLDEKEAEALAIKIQNFEERTLPALEAAKAGQKTEEGKIQADKNIQLAFNKLIANLSPAEQGCLNKIVRSEGKKAADKTSPFKDMNMGGITAKAFPFLIGGGLLGKFVKRPSLGILAGVAASLFSLLAFVPKEFKDVIREQALNFLDGNVESAQIKDFATNLINKQLV